jgi:hypothetical protein
MFRVMSHVRYRSSEKSKLERWIELVAQVAGALSGFAALFAVGLTIHTYNLTTEHQRQQDATDMYRSYRQLTLEHSDLFKKGVNTTNAAADFVITTAESIYLATDDLGWRQTVAQLLNEQAELLESHPWHCKTMNKDFVSFMQNDARVKITCMDK